MRSTLSVEISETWHKVCEDTVGSVRCGHEGLQRMRWRCCSPTFTQEPSKQGMRQILGNVERNDEQKLVLTKFVRDA